MEGTREGKGHDKGWKEKEGSEGKGSEGTREGKGGEEKGRGGNERDNRKD